MLYSEDKNSSAAEALSILQLVERQIRRNPRAVALEGVGSAGLTYGVLRNQINYIVESLNAMGIGRTDRVALIIPNGPEMALAFIGIASGTACAPLNPAFTEREFDFYISDLNPKAVIVHSSLNSPAIAVAKRRGIGICTLSPSANPEAGIFTLRTEVPVASGGPCSHGFADAEDEALILHTSGTTSKAKIVTLTHQNICTSANNIQTSFWLNEDDRCLSVMPLFHVHGLIGALLSSIAAGGSVVCCSRFDPATFFRHIHQFHPTWYTAVPTIHQAVLEHAEHNHEIVRRNRFRFIRSCSAPLPPKLMGELERLFHTPVVESYGMTEAAHQMTSNPLPPYERKPGSVGKASGTEVAIMDKSGNLLPAGRSGEIVVCGRSVTRGYVANPEANATSFVKGWFRTGDEGFLDSDGYLFINGRIKELINRGGEKIAPREIDEALLDHPAVEQAIGFAAPHPTLGEDAYAAVVLRAQSSVSEDALTEFALTRLGISKAPRRVLIVTEIPKGPTGKPQRIGLAEKLGIGAGNKQFVRPESPLECTLAEIWSRLLKLDSISLTDNFFELGGDSLKAAEFVQQLEEQFAIRIPSDVLLYNGTVGTLARALTGPKEFVAWSSLVPLQPRGSKPPFFLINSLGWEPFGWQKLPQHIDPEQPLYVLKSRGLDGKMPPHDHVEAMAADYIQELITVDSHGPYLLGGYSSGGVVAFEMAQQLHAQGKEVRLLVLIDTRLAYGHPFIESHRQSQTRFFRFVQTVDDYVGYFLELCREKRLHTVGDLLRQRAANAFLKTGSRSEAAAGQVGRSIQEVVLETNLRAVANYMPQIYPDRVTLFLCRDEYCRSSRDSRLEWSRVAPTGLELHLLPGNHLSLLEGDGLKVFAGQLSAAIGRTFRSMSRMPEATAPH